MQRHNGILFLTLKIFSATGGIEKVCRVAGKALYELEGDKVQIFSMYDPSSAIDTKYFPEHIFKGFNGKKIKFIVQAIKQGIKKKSIILSHINLLSVGYLIKLISPKTNLILIAHGIEIWNYLPKWKVNMLRKCDKILAVSSYTKSRIKSLYNIDEKCKVLNNCLDPFLPQPVLNSKQMLYNRYNLSSRNFILITVTRISNDEKYKGYDKVIEAIGYLINEFSNLHYLLVGKYDAAEKERLDKLIQQFNLKDKVVLTGFIPDNELAAHYKLADVFIMPSTGEGFGIAFIEAMYYGIPVIAGNRDGSVDALSNGNMGTLIDPANKVEIASAIKKIINNKSDFIPPYNILMRKFSYSTYQQFFKKYIG